MKRKVFKNAPKFDLLQDFAAVIQSGDQHSISRALYQLQISESFHGIAWPINDLHLTICLLSCLPVCAVLQDVLWKESVCLFLCCVFVVEVYSGVKYRVAFQIHNNM
jgi:lysylphosphatidylglycerol synthetase-like protein (DUF2156 family)